MTFLDKIEPALLSEDPFVQQFAIHLLENTYLATPHTLLVALEAIDYGLKVNFQSSILPHINYMPVDEKGLLEILKRVDENNLKSKLHYANLLKNASTDLLLQYKNEIKSLVLPTFIENLKEIKKLETEELFMELGELLNSLEEDGFNSVDYEMCKRIGRELISRDEVPDWEIENGIRSNLAEDEYMPYDGIFNIFMAGERRLESVIPDLMKILKKDEDDLTLNEVTKTLIKIGTEKVVKEVEKVALYKDTYFYSIDVLAKIKTEQAEEALLRLFDQTKDITAKTLIADALCQQLSVNAIPKIEKLLEDGFDASMLDLEESLYANLVLNKINYPYLEQMKASLEEKERHYQEIQKQLANPIRKTKTEKIGRNDPCPCGSGKKYKKCCMK